MCIRDSCCTGQASNSEPNAATSAVVFCNPDRNDALEPNTFLYTDPDFLLQGKGAPDAGHKKKVDQADDSFAVLNPTAAAAAAGSKKISNPDNTVIEDSFVQPPSSDDSDQGENTF